MSGSAAIPMKVKLIIAGVILILLLVIGIVIYSAGNRKGKSKGQVNISTLPADLAGGQGAQASESEIRQLASEIYEDMKGLNVWGHNITPWQRVLALSDTDLVRLSNEFNTSYQKESEQTLKEWVDSEVGGGTAWPTVRETVLTRLNKLNIL
ncbi:MAG TPA: hypothetical protein VEB40_00990 [Flavipsychrobacter sp.]|nr:hypothetical protein [Flavipsychrobacter sp.]